MNTPVMTYLAYSAGTQSHAILEMVLRGHLEKPNNFVVLNADPGMEDERSYGFVEQSRRRCADAGIPFVTASGPNLFTDLTTMKEKGLIRVDNPPYWTKNPKTGKRGKMKQKCTRFYKIEPMRRELRKLMHSMLGVSMVSKRLPPVDVWIGFGTDETHRDSPSDVKFITKKYPLIELGYDKAKVHGYYMKHGIIKPPRSVCVACFANGLAHFEDMYYNRPDDWDKAVSVDEAVRDMSCCGIREEVYVSSTLVPLKDLPGMNFKKYDADHAEHRCNSGVCFV